SVARRGAGARLWMLRPAASARRGQSPLLLCAFAFACASAPRQGTAEGAVPPPVASIATASSDAGDATPDGGAADGPDAGVRGGGIADGGVAGPSQAVLALLARAEAKEREGDFASLGEAARLWEEAAPGTPHPEGPLLSAARARRERAQRADVPMD